MIRVVVVDDHILLRNGIRGLLALTDDISLAGEAGDGEEAIRIITATKPDLVLLDVQMPKLSGIKVIEFLKERDQLPLTILLTTFDDDEALIQGIRAGARGFLLKDVSLERLVGAIRHVMNGESYFRPTLTEQAIGVIKHPPKDCRSQALLNALSRRELEVLALMAGGYSNHEIAGALGTSEGTIKNHVSNILSKLGVRDRVQAVIKGLAAGLLSS